MKIKDKIVYACNSKYVLFFLLIMLYSIRIIFLDADIKAPWGVLTYQAIDEGAYASLALNIENFGMLNPNDYYQGVYNYDISGNSINNLIGNVFTTITLRIFGDNYWGLRMGSIIVGLLIILLTIKILVGLNASQKSKVLSVAFLLTNFVFYNACRIVEPSLYRMLFVQLFILFYVSNINDKIKYFGMGLCVVMSIFLVYITNAFMFIALLAVFIFRLVKKEKKKAFHFFVWNFYGGLAGYFISLIYYWGVWRRTPILSALETIKSFSKSSVSYDVHLFTGTVIFKRLLAFFSSNIFLYCPILLAIAILMLPMAFKLKEERKELIVLLYGLVGGLLFQTIISEDYIVRKSIVVLVVMLIIGMIFLSEYREFKLTSKDIVRLIASTVCSCIIIILNCIYRLYLVSDGTIQDFSYKDRILVWGLAFTSIVLIIAIAQRLIKTSILISVIIKSGFTTLVLLNVILIMKFDFYNLTYSQKNAMIEVGKVVGDGKLCLAYENSITLYNDVKPIVCTYDEINEYMSKDANLFYYGYDNLEEGNSDPQSLSQNVTKVKTYNIDFKTFGEYRRWALYKYDNTRRSILFKRHILVLGDSISCGQISREPSYTDNNWPELLGDEADCYIDNQSIPGSCAGLLLDDGNGDLNSDSMCSNLKRMRLKEYDYIFLAYGANDLSYNIPIGTIMSTDEYTFLGAYNRAINYIHEKNPDIRIVIVTPMIDVRGDSSYIDALVELGIKRDCIVIDLSKIKISNEVYDDVFWDSALHPNEYTHRMIAKYIDKVLDGMDPHTYCITYKVDNSKEYLGVVHQYVVEGCTIDKMPIPYRAGYTFKGWYCEKLKKYISEEEDYEYGSDIEVVPRWRVR